MALPGTYTNRQVRGPCYLCIKVVKWVPVLFILSIVFWSYYAFVIQLCFFTIHSLVQKILYLLIYHILFVMFVWAYFQTIFTTRGSLPNRFRLSDSEVDRIMHAENEDMQNVILERFARDLPTHNRTINNTVRYCDKCRHVKPDRAHHCSVCGECILKMDHHCPWVNNCVCYRNYKFFLLFLGYALVYCIFVSLASMQYFIAFWKGPRETTDKSSGALDGVDGMGRFHILFLFFVAVMFAISLASLFFYHIYLVSVNRTTLEAFRSPIFYNGPDKDGYNLGTKQNFVEVFGENSNLWFLPIFSASGDGVIYPVRTQQPSGSYQTMENSQTSLGDGIVYEKRHTLEDMEELLYECDTRSEVDIE